MKPFELYSIKLKQKLESPELPLPQSLPTIPSGPSKDLLVYVESEDTNEYFNLPDNLVELKSTMPVELEDFYILYGTSGLDGLSDAIENMDNSWNPFYKSDIMKVFEKCRKDMEERAEKACEIIEKRAAKIAKHKLQNSINEILDESVRYLDGISNHKWAEYILVKNLNTWELKPEAGNGLIKALVELRDLRNEFENGAQKWQKLKNSRGPIPMTDLLNTEKSVQVLLRKLLEKTASCCLKYPIIHRLQNTANLPIYPKGTRNFLTASGLREFKTEVFDILSSSYKDAQKLKEDIVKDSSMVWKYRPLIEETLAELNQDDTSFASRAAEEKLADEDDLKDWIENAEILAVGAQTVALVASPAPPVALTISVAATVLGLGSITLEAYEKYQKKTAANAVLDPNLSLSGEPDWGYFLFDVAMEVLGSFSKVPMSVITGLMAGQALLELQE